jgi:non-specific serine/threonine protein kinase/serine/threonine-protein kinase
MDEDLTLGAEGTAAEATIASSSAPAKDGVGSLIGPYKLVRSIGVGGMGVVYLAEQQYPVRRQVALKIIKQGMDSEQVIARFGAERQALALMDHPNIARVFDAGTTDSGRPYFAMELVQGLPITKYCDANKLTVRERLELFVPVCQAIQHAHQKGVIHRDIKPSNVLVAAYDGKPVPKVIDFGIAKATGNQLTEETMFTQLGLVVGTLEYMSPEQATANSQDIDTRSDVYSLGALLYELLAGVTPIAASALRESAYLEVLRKIREDEPPSPSSRLAQSTETIQETSERRKIDPERLPKLLRGELDWIVMRALEKDRVRRYETANGFARDIERYLSGEPVEAGPPSATYRLKKFANKNRALLATAAAFAALLVLGATVSIWQAVRARRAERVADMERDRANSEAASAKAVADFLQNSLLSQASAYRQNGEPDPNIRVRTLLDRAAADIGGKFQGKPAIEADIRGTIGATYHDLGLLPQAAEQYQKQYELDMRSRGAQAPETYEALSNLATSRSDAGKLAEAAGMREQAVAGLTRSLGPEDPRTIAATRALGNDYDLQGEYAKADPLLTKALAEQTRALGPDDVATLDTVDSLEELYIDDDRSSTAEKLAADTLDRATRRYGLDHPLTLRAMFRLGGIYERIGKYAESEAALIAALQGSTRLLGPEHPDTLGIMDMLAQALDDQGKHAQAVAMQLKLYEADRRRGPDLPDTITEEAGLATIYLHAGDSAKGEQL